MGETITVVGYDDTDPRDDDDERGERGLRDLIKRKPVEVGDLQKEMSAFVGKMRGVLGEVPDELGKWALESVTLTLEVSATGKVNLVGTGAEVTGKGGIQLMLTRS